MPRKSEPEKKERIIQAAKHILLSRSFHDMRIADIAKKANVAEGTIYRYFRNKQDLFISVLYNINSYLVSIFFADISPANSFQINIQHMVSNFFTKRNKFIGLYKILYKAFAEMEDAQIKQVLETCFGTIHMRMREIFQWGIDRKEITENNIDIDTMSLLIYGVGETLWKDDILSSKSPQEREYNITESVQKFFQLHPFNQLGFEKIIENIASNG
jgi:AcrR family transcriptional regulator